MPELPHDLIGLLGYALFVGGPIATMWVQVRKQDEKLSKQGKQINDVHSQVKNDHPDDPNMRHQLDSMDGKIDLISDAIGDMRKDHGRLERRVDRLEQR